MFAPLMGVSATSLLLFDFAKIPTFPKLPNFSDRNEEFFCVCGLIPFSEDLFRVLCTEVPGYSKRCFLGGDYCSVLQMQCAKGEGERRVLRYSWLWSRIPNAMQPVRCYAKVLFYLFVVDIFATLEIHIGLVNEVDGRLLFGCVFWRTGVFAVFSATVGTISGAVPTRVKHLPVHLDDRPEESVEPPQQEHYKDKYDEEYLSH